MMKCFSPVSEVCEPWLPSKAMPFQSTKSPVVAVATRIVFEERRAVGIEYRHDGRTRAARASAEVILSAGPIKSPQLLELSGIGQPDRLAAHGDIPCMLTNPSIRPFVRSIIERVRPATVVLSQNEIHTRARVRALGTIG